MSIRPLSDAATLDLIRMLEDGELSPGDQARRLAEEGLAISSLPPELQQIVQTDPSLFQEGDLDLIDTENEARKLIETAIGTENPGLQGDPALDALDNLSSPELIQLLIDWLQNGGDEQLRGGTQPPRSLGGEGFTGQPQPTTWNPTAGAGHGGGAPSGGVSPASYTPSYGGPQGVPDVSSFNNLSAEQKQNAQTIIDVGREMGASDRDIQIALMTAMQESGLRNLNHGDRDSLGLFQQRPSQGWGSPDQVTDPRYAAAKFYEGLLALPNRDSMRLTEAAQAVQRSAFPEAYAKHEGVALALLQELGDATLAA